MGDIIYEALEDFESCGEKIKKGQRLYKYYGCTYGCISYEGIAVTWKKDKIPFFEVPFEKVKEV